MSFFYSGWQKHCTVSSQSCSVGEEVLACFFLSLAWNSVQNCHGGDSTIWQSQGAFAKTMLVERLGNYSIYHNWRTPIPSVIILYVIIPPFLIMSICSTVLDIGGQICTPFIFDYFSAINESLVPPENLSWRHISFHVRCFQLLKLSESVFPHFRPNWIV